MPKIVTIAQMQAIEAAAAQGGLAEAMMMEYAGRAVARVALERLPHALPHYAVLLCGGGNNGGDGLVAAFHLAEAGLNVVVYATHTLEETDPKVQRLRRQGVRLVEAASDLNWLLLHSILAKATLVVDAVLGTGARLPVRGLPAVVLQYTGQCLAARTHLRPLCLAVDCPSGLQCDTGALDPVALAADITVTFGAAKMGHLAFPGAAVVGELVVDAIDIPADLPALASIPLELATAAQVRAWLPPRPRDAHKGTFGRVLVVAGSVNYTGAAYLAGAAAYRIGAGIVCLAVPEPLYPVLAGHLPEATWRLLPTTDGAIAASAVEVVEPELAKTQALLLGPGWGLAPGTAQFLQGLLSFAAHWPPAVVDADGLKLLATLPDWAQRLPPHTVLTPHPGEMSTLTRLDKATLQAQRIEIAQRFAAQWGHVVVLKGAFTIVAAPDGRTTMLPFATAALARAGTGDVLAGAIAGLLAQGLRPYEAALLGGYVQGRAGELVAQQMGTTASVLAGEVLASLPMALKEMA